MDFSFNTEYHKIMTLCRICLQTVENKIDLCSETKESKDILDKIYLCFQITFHFEKKMPSVICTNCIQEVEIAYNFKNKCKTFDERFRELNKHTDLSKIVYTNESQKLETVVKNDTDNVSIQLIYESDQSLPGSVSADLNSDKMQQKIPYNVNYFQCVICNKVLKTASSLQKHNISMHQKRKHLGNVTGCGAARRYHCTKCSYSTPHSQTLINHMRRHNGERPYHCHCGKSFTQCSSLAAHRKTHSTNTFYTCSVCGKQFKHAFTLKKHSYVHDTGKFFCDLCHKNLKSRQSLQDHIYRHYNIRNYNCDDCGNTFVTCSELLNHKKKHSIEKQVECHLCGYKTNTKKNLIVHLKRHTGDKTFKCGHCNVTCYTNGDLQRHQRVHTREKPFACSVCAQRFTYSSSLNKHMQTVHNIEYKWADVKRKALGKNKILKAK